MNDLPYIVTREGHVVPYEPKEGIMDESLWRVGSHHDIHIYNAFGVPIATAMTAESAKQIVDEHNQIREMHSKKEILVEQIKKEEVKELPRRCEVHNSFHVFGPNCK